MEKGSEDAKRRPRRERKEEEENPQATAPAKEEGGPVKARRNRGGDDGGGWMSLDSKPAAPKVIEDFVDPDQPEIVAQNKDKHFQENSDELVLIPDLDEDGGDSDQRVARAPRNTNRRVPTLQELENEVKATLPSSDTGLDLGILFATLVPAEYVQEPDETWNFDTLLREVTEELQVPSPDATKKVTSSVPTSSTNTKVVKSGNVLGDDDAADAKKKSQTSKSSADKK